MNRGLVLGFFDGVHIAHQAVINSALEVCDEVFVITFSKSPAEFFRKNFYYILNRKDSINKIKSLGVKQVIELDFSEIASMPAKNYLEKIIKDYSPNHIFTGYDHTFGKNKTGNATFLANNAEKYNYEYHCIPAQKVGNNVISSTLIRNLLSNGEIKKANKLLSSNFCITGVVVHGAQLGRTIGFPTANIKYPQNLIHIPYGVYSAKVNNNYGVLNWGMKPTVHNTKEPIAEMHILDFNKNIYGEIIKIEILDRIRNEEKFNNLDDLKAQINEDIKACLK